MMDILSAVMIADSNTKGYKFHCASMPDKCRECGNLPVAFITQDLEEACQHSTRNHVAMWISKD